MKIQTENAHFELRRAEEEVNRSKLDFERAMDHLEDAVEVTAIQIRHRIERIKLPLQIAQAYIKQTQLKYMRAKMRAEGFARQVKSGEPKPVALVAGIALGFLVTAGFILRMKIKNRARAVGHTAYLPAPLNARPDSILRPMTSIPTAETIKKLSMDRDPENLEDSFDGMDSWAS